MMQNSSLFVEIRQQPTKQYTEAVIVSPVLPQNCRALILRLNEALPPHASLSHLKRVRTRNKSISVLLYPSPDAGYSHPEDVCIILEQLRKENYQISSLQVPARLAETRDEWTEFNAVWPTKYIVTAPPTISTDELRSMHQGLKLAQDHGGVVIVDPITEHDTNGELRIIATASQEAKEQGYPDNPLATNIILAIQGVSRLERAVLIQGDNTSSNGTTTTMDHLQKNQQYLCTNYDVYCVKEPSVFEAMALLHSRIRRLTFAESVDDGGITKHMIHALQLTNHRYRAFQQKQG